MIKVAHSKRIVAVVVALVAMATTLVFGVNPASAKPDGQYNSYVGHREVACRTAHGSVNFHLNFRMKYINGNTATFKLQKVEMKPFNINGSHVKPYRGNRTFVVVRTGYAVKQPNGSFYHVLGEDYDRRHPTGTRARKDFTAPNNRWSSFWQADGQLPLLATSGGEAVPAMRVRFTIEGKNRVSGTCTWHFPWMKNFAY